MAAAKRQEQEKARDLRRQGWSVKRIARELSVSQSSVSVWVRDVTRPSGPLRPDDAPVPRRLVVWRSGRSKVCGRCRLRLPDELFNRHRATGRQAWCRGCFQKYFRERGDKHRQQSGAARALRVQRAAEHVLGVLRGRRCEDCGETDPVVLEFDHLRDKAAVVAHLVSTGAKPSVLDDEIAKCDVVCVNCHRRRTGRRAGWRKASPKWWETPAPAGPARARNLAVVYSILETYGCADCRTRDLCVLEFDHVRGKTAPVFRLAHEPRSLEVVLDEVARCEIRCGNCHRRRHARDAESFRHRQAAS